ncbi:DNA-binding protein [Jeotgalibacillus sp. ET6]|uniref:DNA-binding protein n=1 Tax=Jeotgalibacillus sp. ET6 TaxID=3037260 RepID=UPI0024183859|nr:DNA-binding protein [Jeotgalibacillus sp. ET6]MDG5473510.1 DNA-binding protein [Jeotgalibacillus sp. ET6]
MELDFFWIGAGLTAMGYFIGSGLKKSRSPKMGFLGISSDQTLMKTDELAIYLPMTKEEIEELFIQYPSAPRIVVNGTTYVNWEVFSDWLSKTDTYRP